MLNVTNDIPPESMNEIIDLIHDNQKLEAVKRYRSLRGTSLLEAKTFIEELTERLKDESTLAAMPELDQIAELIYAGQKLEAVKRYRELRSIKLMDAKRFIEQWTEDLRQKHPERFYIRSTTGCAGVFALVVIALAATAAELMMV